MEADTQETIEVGAADGEFRLYKARATREAAEVYLLGQERSYSATEARATNLLGWTITGVVALTSRMLISGFDRPLFVATAFLFLSSVFSCSVLWPGVWHPAGAPPEEFANWSVQTELELQEWVAAGYAGAIAANRKVARRACYKMRAAWVVAFLSAPVAALVYHFLS